MRSLGRTSSRTPFDQRNESNTQRSHGPLTIESRRVPTNGSVFNATTGTHEEDAGRVGRGWEVRSRRNHTTLDGGSKMERSRLVNRWPLVLAMLAGAGGACSSNTPEVTGADDPQTEATINQLQHELDLQATQSGINVDY